MSEALIPIIQREGELVADSRALAAALEIEHEAFLRTLSAHQSTVENEFGLLRFENGTVTNSVGAVNKTRFAFLTEDQALFVATLSRNSAPVVRVKAWLVKAFAAARAALQPVAPVPALPQTYTEAVRALLAKCEENDSLKLAVADMEPKAAFADAVQFGIADMNVGTFAKIIGVKHLFQWLRDNRYLYYRDGHNVPYAQYDQNGQNLFRVRMVPKGDHVYPCTSITGKGQLHIAAKLGITPTQNETTNIVQMLA